LVWKKFRFKKSGIIEVMNFAIKVEGVEHKSQYIIIDSGKITNNNLLNTGPSEKIKSIQDKPIIIIKNLLNLIFLSLTKQYIPNINK
jgi:hypothetical protein